MSLIAINFPTPKWPFSSKEDLSRLVKNDPTAANNQLTSESLLISRAALAVIATCASAYFLANPNFYVSGCLAVTGLFSVPSALMMTGTYFTLEGLYSIASTQKVENLFQNLCWGVGEIVTGAALLYSHSLVGPIGIAEPTLAAIAKDSANERRQGMEKS